MGGVFMSESKGTKVMKGTLRGVILTLIMLGVLSIIMSFKELSSQFISVYILVVTCLSIIFGSIYTARKNNEKGWIMGFLVSVCYMLILYLASIIFFRDLSFGIGDILRIIIAVVVGTLAGMLGINL
jgi:putative membrane protein (TIGR04086 family)